ncbi:putative multiple organellar RNA editing factor 2, chloroplastic isoform X1 [Iris pallida]|uniref:Multiple organellar RNA editing factor 2, chloroplastic isoform X1 n=1 Tax=Iris pallida TaxID=29817 RepID=A0AAX6G0H2_IRIPA|nr:putative multiple organellar RNA editing factor 2, chloroplastic isoform X1 [Iris pallida]
MATTSSPLSRSTPAAHLHRRHHPPAPPPPLFPSTTIFMAGHRRLRGIRDDHHHHRRHHLRLPSLLPAPSSPPPPWTPATFAWPSPQLRPPPSPPATPSGELLRPFLFLAPCCCCRLPPSADATPLRRREIPISPSLSSPPAATSPTWPSPGEPRSPPPPSFPLFPGGQHHRRAVAAPGPAPPRAAGRPWAPRRSSSEPSRPACFSGSEPLCSVPFLELRASSSVHASSSGTLWAPCCLGCVLSRFA